MEVDILDAHDRHQYFTKQNFSIEECCQDIINQRPYGDHPFYIFVHARTDDDGVTKRLIWMPRLTKPRAQTNSMLFKGYPGTDLLKIIWIIPERNMWKNYEKGKVGENTLIYDCIHKFEHNREELEKPEEDDLSDEIIHKIYSEISKEARKKKAKQETLVASSF